MCVCVGQRLTSGVFLNCSLFVFWMSLTEVGSQDLARMDGQQALPGDLPVPAFLVLGLQVHDIVSGFSSQRVVAQRRYRGLNFSSCAYIASTVLLISLSSSGIFFFFFKPRFLSLCCSGWSPVKILSLSLGLQMQTYVVLSFLFACWWSEPKSLLVWLNHLPRTWWNTFNEAVFIN